MFLGHEFLEHSEKMGCTLINKIVEEIDECERVYPVVRGSHLESLVVPRDPSVYREVLVDYEREAPDQLVAEGVTVRVRDLVLEPDVVDESEDVVRD